MQSAPAPAPPPRDPGKRTRILASLAPVLAIMTVISTIYLFHWKRQYSRLAKEKRGRTLSLPILERTRELLDRAEKYGRMRDPDLRDIQGLVEAARDEATVAMRLVPDSEEAYRLRGRAYELLHDFAGAREDYEDAIKNHQESPARLLLGALGVRELARARLADGKLALVNLEDLAHTSSELLRRFRAPPPDFTYATMTPEERAAPERDERALIDPKHRAIATLLNSYAYAEHDRVPIDVEAAQIFDTTEWITPHIGGLSLWELKKDREAAESFARAARILPMVADPHAWLGRTLHRLGRKTEAIEALSRAIDADPRFVEAYYVRGGIRHEEGLFEDSREDFRKCAELVPSLPEIQLKLGIASWEYWERTGRTKPAELEAAEKALTQYLAAKPGDAAALLVRARTRAGRKEAAKAEEDLAAASKLLPDSPEPHEVLAALHEAGQKWEAAEQEYGIVIGKAPGTPRALVAQLARARLRARMGRTEDALSDYDALLARDSNDTFFLEKADLLRRAGKLDEARATVDKALELNPRNARALSRRAEILLERGEVDAAIEEAARAYRADPQLADSLVVRGKAFLKKGMKAEAAADWRDAVRLRRDLEAELAPLIRQAEQ